MKEILNEWKKYLAEQEDAYDGEDEREKGPGKTDTEKKEDEAPVKTVDEARLLQFGEELTPEKYRQALQNFRDYAPEDKKYPFVKRSLPKVLNAAINPEKTKPELLKRIATNVNISIENLMYKLEKSGIKVRERYIDLVIDYGRDRFNSRDVAAMVMLDAGYPLL